jgi:hypothetical protein
MYIFLYIHRYDDSLSRYQEYDIQNNNNETPAEWFVGQLKNISQEVEVIFDNPKLMIPLSIEQQDQHHNTTICHICEDESRPFDSTNPSDCKIYDHCHLTGIILKSTPEILGINIVYKIFNI